MELRGIPVLLVVAGKKICGIPTVIANLREHCGFERFFVVCPERDMQQAEDVLQSLTVNVTVMNEGQIVRGLTLHDVAKNLHLKLEGWPENHLAGWYYQQFLKIGFAKFYIESDYYLIWDADTLLTKPITFLDDSTVLLTAGNEYHVEYFNTISRLLPGVKLSSGSHISQHLMVKRLDMLSLISDLENGDTSWWKNVLAHLNGDTPFQFSEYETYASYCLTKWPDRYRSVRRPWFRYGKSYFGADLESAKVSDLADLYDFVAFEQWDNGLIRRLRAICQVCTGRIRLKACCIN